MRPPPDRGSVRVHHGDLEEDVVRGSHVRGARVRELPPRAGWQDHLVVASEPDAFDHRGVRAHADEPALPCNALVVGQHPFELSLLLRAPLRLLLSLPASLILAVALVRVGSRLRATLGSLTLGEVSLALVLLALELVRGAERAVEEHGDAP